MKSYRVCRSSVVPAVLVGLALIILPACQPSQQNGGTPGPSATSSPTAAASPTGEGAGGNVTAQESTLESQEKETDATTITARTAAAAPAEKLHGRFTEFSLPQGSFPQFLALGRDGAIYFAQGNGNKIGRIASPSAADSGKLPVQDFPIPTPNSFPIGVAIGSDGAVWFTEKGGHKIGRLDPGSKSVAEYATPTANSGPVGIVVGSDGAIWFTEADANKIGRLDPKDPKSIKEFAVPTANSAPIFITAGPDQAMWFAEVKGHKIGRVDASGAVQEFATTTPNSGPACVITGPDNALWVSELNADKIARFDVSAKKFTDEIDIKSRKNGPRSGPGILVNGSDGNIWFTEMYGNQIARLNPKNKQVHEFTVPSSVKLEQAAAPSAGAGAAGGGKPAWRDENKGGGGVSDTSGPGSIVTSSDGTIWYTAMFAGKIARLRVSKA